MKKIIILGILVLMSLAFAGVASAGCGGVTVGDVPLGYSLTLEDGTPQSTCITMTENTIICLVKDSIRYSCMLLIYNESNKVVNMASIQIDQDSTRTVINLSGVVVPDDNILTTDHTLYVTSSNANGGYICPNAEALGGVYDGCSGGYSFPDGGGTYGSVTISKNYYGYKISGLSGSGAGANPMGGGGAAVPEFSDYAIILIVLTAIGGFFLVKRKQE